MRPAPHSKLDLFLGVRDPRVRVRNATVLVGFLVLLLASTRAFISEGSKYPFLDGNLYWWFLVIPSVLVGISFRARVYPFTDLSDYPLAANLLGRIGFLLPVAISLAVAIVVANGVFDRTIDSRVVNCQPIMLGQANVRYLRVKPWVGSNEEAEVPVSRRIYAAANEGAPITLTTGRGWLGIEWVRDVAAPQ
jgi:hypothetical protein